MRKLRGLVSDVLLKELKGAGIKIDRIESTSINWSPEAGEALQSPEGGAHEDLCQEEEH